jgi:hypothetical protein
VDSIGDLWTEYAPESIELLLQAALGQARINEYAHGPAGRRLAMDKVGER